MKSEKVTVAWLLDRAQKEAHRLTGRNTRYQVAKLLQVTQGNLKGMADGYRPVPDAVAVRLAGLAGVPRAWVVPCLHAEWCEKNHPGDDVSRVWREIADAMVAASPMNSLPQQQSRAAHG